MEYQEFDDERGVARVKLADGTVGEWDGAYFLPLEDEDTDNNSPLRCRYCGADVEGALCPVCGHDVGAY
jgi:rubrerythrin